MKRPMELRIFGSILISSLLLIASSSSRAELLRADSKLEKIKARGELTVITRSGPTTFYRGPYGLSGFEYDLAQAFADFLGVELNIIVADSPAEIISAVAHGDADFAAAGLAKTPSRLLRVRFGPAYAEVTSQVIYRAGRPAPASVEDLIGSRNVVVAGSSHAEKLKQLGESHSDLTWIKNGNLDGGEILHLVLKGVADYAIMDSNRITLNRRFHPELKVAFDLGEPRQLAWAFTKSADDSLYRAAEEFFGQIEDNGKLAQAGARHYGHAARMGYFGTLMFMRHVNERLPDYRGLFERTAKEHALDWRLLAAMSYQESLWDPLAESPTGVRGLMMLTLDTAAQLGIEDRVDPLQSITGGAMYYNIVKAKIPERIAEPDRSWMAMAAYNIGFGHLEDARVLTEKLGGDPDNWVDVMRHLPLLSQKKWCGQTEYGCVRGNEPVNYVQNVRNYYDILVWLTEKERLVQSEITVLEASLEDSDEASN